MVPVGIRTRAPLLPANNLRTDGKEINWDLIHAASQSVADIAIHTMQDVLGLDSGHRMNLPGKPEGNWNGDLPGSR